MPNCSSTPKEHFPTPGERDERHAIPLDNAETALKALLAVDPEEMPEEGTKK